MVWWVVVGPGTAVTARWARARRGSVGLAIASPGLAGVVRRGGSWHAVFRLGSRGLSCLGVVGWGLSRLLWQVGDRRGMSRQSLAAGVRRDMPGLVLVRQIRLGPSVFAWARHVAASSGLAVQAWFVSTRLVTSGFGRLGMAR